MREGSGAREHWELSEKQKKGSWRSESDGRGAGVGGGESDGREGLGPW